jgi:uncharacterized membrane protein
VVWWELRVVGMLLLWGGKGCALLKMMWVSQVRCSTVRCGSGRYGVDDGSQAGMVMVVRQVRCGTETMKGLIVSGGCHP